MYTKNYDFTELHVTQSPYASLTPRVFAYLSCMYMFSRTFIPLNTEQFFPLCLNKKFQKQPTDLLNMIKYGYEYLI